MPFPPQVALSVAVLLPYTQYAMTDLPVLATPHSLDNLLANKAKYVKAFLPC